MPCDSMQIFPNLEFRFFQNSSSKKGKIPAFSGYVPCTVVPQEISKEIRGASNEMADFLSPRRGGTSLGENVSRWQRAQQTVTSVARIMRDIVRISFVA